MLEKCFGFDYKECKMKIWWRWLC